MSSKAQLEPSRKRAAPGAWPQNPPANLQTSNMASYDDTQDALQKPDNQFLTWGGDPKYHANSGPRNTPQYAGPSQFGALPGRSNGASTQLVRKLNSAQMGDPQQHHAAVQSQLQRLDNNRQSPNPGDDSDEDEGDLDARAQEAKRDAQTRRPPRSIPPFIQKLSRFLDDPRSHDLIRWAEDGRSFIVLDEDRFANELIPEMFKHNNYASFVRQLNMYGFHKKVGLSDNSMRASEKKAKLPSGYRHKYFRRGRPDLLWLIEKPKSGTESSAKRRGPKTALEENDEHAPDGNGGPRSLPQPSASQDLITLPRSEIGHVGALQGEVKELQSKQNEIFKILQGMRAENKQYIQQARAMVANHERHESSINAILQFLATFYNQSLQGGGNANIGNMFNNSIPNNQPQSSVVEDMGDYAESPTDWNQQQQLPRQRRPLALLPPPQAREQQANSPLPHSPQVRTETPSNGSLHPPKANNSARSSVRPSPEAENTSTSDNNNNILNVINRTNAAGSSRPRTQNQNQPRYDLSALQQYSQNANGANNPLTPEQRNAMLSMMNAGSGQTTPSITTNTHTNTNSTAFNNPNQTTADPNPMLDYFQNNADQLELLERMQREQDSKVQDLAGRLQPLSPNGNIPGLDMPPSPNQNLNLNLNQQHQSQSQFPAQFNPDSPGFDFGNYLNDDPFDTQQQPQTQQDAVDPSFDFEDIDWDSMPQSANDDALFADSAGFADGDFDGGDGVGLADGVDGDGDDFGRRDEADNGQEVGFGGGGGGRVVGSVGSSDAGDGSNGRPTPGPPTGPPSVQDDPGGGGEDLNGGQRRRKKRKTGD